MTTDFKKSKYFKFLLKNLNEVEKERVEFNNQILTLLNKETDELGTILKCHLIIEYYLDCYLKSSYPTISKWKETRLTFNQKLELINTEKTFMEMYYPSIKCLNSIRNKFSHRISYKVVSGDYREIETIMNVWYNAIDQPLPKGMRLIEEFTIWVCSNIASMINGIDKHSKSIGLPGYLRWLQDMQEAEK